MKFIADLHVHSKYSRATSKALDLEHLYVAAQCKGITVLATGDFTHPGWFAELTEKLVPEEPGLFRLRNDIAAECDRHVPRSCRGPVRFLLETEISCIYKKNDRTRKNHNLIYMPDLETASRLNSKLDAIGNISSDGRPILGLDARDLLEIMLECSPDAFLVPAHIWTPWFSLFGSKSGFDAMEECFEDLSSEIFAVETGLSSNAPMNWRISELDSRTLISNSDAHSTGTLGRNANRLDAELSFFEIRSAWKAKDPARCLGTLDLFPEEGKYHMDGHRKCDLRLSPAESLARDGICPVCDKPLTLGVLHRVEVLADRPEGQKPAVALPFVHWIPLPEILSEIFNVGPKTKTVETRYRSLLQELGPEADILLHRPVEDIDKTGIPLLGEAIKRMRAGKVHLQPGYDGEYGRITVFDPEEKAALSGQKSLFGIPRKKSSAAPKPNSRSSVPPPKPSSKAVNPKPKAADPREGEGMLDGLNPPQREAVLHEGSPLLIVAGPGTGKTRTLTHRIAYLIRERGVNPAQILAVTFTNKAAAEMRERLAALLSPGAAHSAELPTAATFHSLCVQILKEIGHDDFQIIDDDHRKALVREAAGFAEREGGEIPLKVDRLADMIGSAKQFLLGPDDDLSSVFPSAHGDAALAVYIHYQELLELEGLLDYDDLLFRVVRLLETDPAARKTYAERFQHILVDEYQDLNHAQYRMIQALSNATARLCVIGDPDQSIYGFRGSNVAYFERFTDDYPGCRVIHLARNYRSTQTILNAARQVMGAHSLNPADVRIYSDMEGIHRTVTVLELPTDRVEAVAIGKMIESLVGGTGFHSVDFGKVEGFESGADRSFSDVAILYRSHAQSRIIGEVFQTAGIPYQIADRRSIFDQKGIAELLSLFKIIENQGTFPDLQKAVRFLNAGWGKADLERFRDRQYHQKLSLQKVLDPRRQTSTPGLDGPLVEKVSVLREKLLNWKTEVGNGTVAEKLESLLEKTRLGQALRETRQGQTALKRLLCMAADSGRDPERFLTSLALQSDSDVHDPRAQKVSLMTLHAAKGLEFPVVFISGCEKGFHPFQRSETEPIHEDEEKEERRLFYVGMTRAKDQLILTRSAQRAMYGKIVPREMSVYVQEIEDRLISFEKTDPKRTDNRDHQKQLGLFN